MTSQDIYHNMLPLLTQTKNQGLMSNPNYAKAFNIAAQGQSYRNSLDKALMGQKAKMFGGEGMMLASPIVGAVNPTAGGAMFGAGNAMLHNLSPRNIAMNAGIGAGTGAIASKIAPMINNGISNLYTNISSKLSGQPTGMAASLTDKPAVQEAFVNKFGASPNMTSLEYRNPNIYNRTATANNYDTTASNIANSLRPTINNSTPSANLAPLSIERIATPQQIQSVERVSPMNQVTNDFSNTLPGNTIIRQYDSPATNMFNSTNDFLPSSPSFGGQFGGASAPMESSGGLNSLINAENYGGGGLFSEGMLNSGGQSSTNFANDFLNGGGGWF